MSNVKTIGRRKFLLGSTSAALILPTALESVASASCVPGMPCVGPQRFILMHHSQGTVLSHWRPVGSETNFTLPQILQPLAPHQNDCLFIGGLDNVASGLMAGVGNGHSVADTSIYTCNGYADNTVDVPELRAAGPSIDQVIAERIQGDTPVRALSLGVTGGSAISGLQQSNVLSKGFNDPVVNTVNPMEVYYKFLVGGTSDVDAAAALLERRVSILDAVLENFNHLKSKVSQSDKQLLEAHATKVFELEQQLIALEQVKETCGGYGAPNVPTGYQWWSHGFEVTAANLQMDIMLFALSCGLTNVASLEFMYGHSPSFPWLEAEFGGPLVNTSSYDNWHGMVHSGRNIDGNLTPEPGLVLGYRHYSDMFALLLEKMKQVPMGNGETLLDSSLVLWGSEFGDGLGHNTIGIPYVLAGTTGGISMGRWLNFDAQNGAPQRCTNELYVAVLQAFGQVDTSFGNHMGLATGPLPGVLS